MDGAGDEEERALGQNPSIAKYGEKERGEEE